MIDKIHASLPIDAKLEPIRAELVGIVRRDWSGMLPQTRRAAESAIASLDAAIAAEREEAARKAIASQPIARPGPSSVVLKPC